MPATIATPIAATMTCTSSSSQSMPLVCVGMPSARAMNVPMNAATMPMTIVSQMGIGCRPGTTSRPSAPTMAPTIMAGGGGGGGRVPARHDQPAKRPDDGADDYGGDDASDGHGPSRLPQGRSIDPRTGVPGRTHYVDTKM